MTAARIREAAKVLRDAAENATPGPWVAKVGTYEGEVGGPYEGAQIPNVAQEVSDYYIGTVPPLEVADATYIALMQPPVALALADWLENEAEYTSDSIDRVWADDMANTILGGKS